MGASAAEHEKLAVPLGQLIASRGLDLLTGGGPGCMTSVSKAFVETEGRRCNPFGAPLLLRPTTSRVVDMFTHSARPRESGERTQ